MKLTAQIADIKLTTTPRGDIIGKVTLSDGRVVFSKNEKTSLVEALSVGQTAEFDCHEESTPKGAFLVLDDVKVIESKETAPEAKTEPEPAQNKQTEQTEPEAKGEALIKRISEAQSHGKKYWVVETDFFGTIYCVDEPLLIFGEGDKCELTVKVTEKGAMVLTGAKVIKAAEKQTSSAQPVKPTTPPAPPKSITENAEQQTAQQNATQQKDAEQKKADPPKVPPVPSAVTDKTHPTPPQVTGNNGEQKAAKPAPVPKPAPAPRSNSAPAEPTANKREEKNNPNLFIWENVRSLPKEALKPFNNGRFVGTSMNSVCAIKMLTALFGPVGIGWVFEVVRNERVKADNGEEKVFVTGRLRYKHEGQWSEWIYGFGGNSFISINKKTGEIYVDDDAEKKAVTDAFMNCCKYIGLGADIYWSADPDSKYT